MKDYFGIYNCILCGDMDVGNWTPGNPDLKRSESKLCRSCFNKICIYCGKPMADCGCSIEKKRASISGEGKMQATPGGAPVSGQAFWKPPSSQVFQKRPSTERVRKPFQKPPSRRPESQFADRDGEGKGTTIMDFFLPGEFTKTTIEMILEKLIKPKDRTAASIMLALLRTIFLVPFAIAIGLPFALLVDLLITIKNLIVGK